MRPVSVLVASALPRRAADTKPCSRSRDGLGPWPARQQRDHGQADQRGRRGSSTRTQLSAELQNPVGLAALQRRSRLERRRHVVAGHRLADAGDRDLDAHCDAPAGERAVPDQVFVGEALAERRVDRRQVGGASCLRRSRRGCRRPGGRARSGRMSRDRRPTVKIRMSGCPGGREHVRLAQLAARVRAVREQQDRARANMRRPSAARRPPRPRRRGAFRCRACGGFASAAAIAPPSVVSGSATLALRLKVTTPSVWSALRLRGEGRGGALGVPDRLAAACWRWCRSPARRRSSPDRRD